MVKRHEAAPVAGLAGTPVLQERLLCPPFNADLWKIDMMRKVHY